VIELGEVPTPITYFAAQHLGTRACAMVTGSHNPADYNGFKLALGGRALYGEGIQALRARIEEGYFTAGSGALEHADVRAAYLEQALRSACLNRPLRIALDCGNGVAGPLARRLLERAGCTVRPLYCEVDGHFPNHHPNPSVPENLEDLAATVRDEGLDLGLALDGDGDRLGVVDDRGEIIWPDRLLMFFAAEVLRAVPGATIIYDVKSTGYLEDFIRARGGEPLMWHAGHSLLRAKLLEHRAALAGELSGHFFFNDRWFGFDDALYAALRLLELVARDPRPAHAVFAELPGDVCTPEINVPFPREGGQHAFMDAFLKEARFEAGRICALDGLRVDYPDGWGLVRASNTTPSLVLRFEGRDAATLARIQALFAEQLRRVDPTLALPFPSSATPGRSGP
jgi:phosphomannomutase/phosphoglucomutase